MKFEHEPMSPAVLEVLGDRLSACSKDVIDFAAKLDLDGIEGAWRARTPSGELASLIFHES